VHPGRERAHEMTRRKRTRNHRNIRNRIGIVTGLAIGLVVVSQAFAGGTIEKIVKKSENNSAAHSTTLASNDDKSGKGEDKSGKGEDRSGKGEDKSGKGDESSDQGGNDDESSDQGGKGDESSDQGGNDDESSDQGGKGDDDESQIDNPIEPTPVVVIEVAPKADTQVTSAGPAAPVSQESTVASAVATVNTAPFLPPAHKPKKPRRLAVKSQICPIVRIGQKSVSAGRAHGVKVTATRGGNPLAGAIVWFKGAGVNKVGKTGRGGSAVVSINAPRAGIITVSVAGKKACSVQHLGVVGTFEPPVTG